MVGEVWLASGQSNMEMPVKGYASEPINGNNELILHSKNPKIRMITIKRNSSPQAVDDFVGSWKEASPNNTGDSVPLPMYLLKNSTVFWIFPSESSTVAGEGLL